MRGRPEDAVVDTRSETTTVTRTRREVGRRLKALRQSRGMSLRDAGFAADLSPSFIGLVERGETEIALSRLIRLADAYGAVVIDLLSDVHEPMVEYVPLREALRVETNVEGIEVHYLSSPSWPMEPFRIQLEPGAQLTGLRHSTEEFVHCIAGHATFEVGGTRNRLSPGDTIWVPTQLEHGYMNDSAEPAVLVGAVLRKAEPSPDEKVSWAASVRRAARQSRQP